MKKGFTLIELLAVIIVLGVLAVIIVPIAQKGLDENAKDAITIQKKNIKKAAQDWGLKNIDALPDVGAEPIKIKLGELKEGGYLPINMKNPDTSTILSNESYVSISNDSGDYIYDVKLYDIPDKINTNGLTFTEKDGSGIIWTKEVKISNIRDNNYDIVIKDSNNNILQHSKQYILNDKEVGIMDIINSSETGDVYSIIYTVLYNDVLYKGVRTVTIIN